VAAAGGAGGSELDDEDDDDESDDAARKRLSSEVKARSKELCKAREREGVDSASAFCASSAAMARSETDDSTRPRCADKLCALLRKMFRLAMAASGLVAASLMY